MLANESNANVWGAESALVRLFGGENSRFCDSEPGWAESLLKECSFSFKTCSILKRTAYAMRFFCLDIGMVSQFKGYIYGAVADGHCR